MTPRDRAYVGKLQRQSAQFLGTNRSPALIHKEDLSGETNSQTDNVGCGTRTKLGPPEVCGVFATIGSKLNQFLVAHPKMMQRV